MSIEGQGHFFTIYFPGFVCFVLYLAKISGERLQDHWSSGFINIRKNPRECWKSQAETLFYNFRGTLRIWVLIASVPGLCILITFNMPHVFNLDVLGYKFAHLFLHPTDDNLRKQKQHKMKE